MEMALCMFLFRLPAVWANRLNLALMQGILQVSKMAYLAVSCFVTGNLSCTVAKYLGEVREPPRLNASGSMSYSPCSDVDKALSQFPIADIGFSKTTLGHLSNVTSDGDLRLDLPGYTLVQMIVFVELTWIGLNRFAAVFVEGSFQPVTVYASRQDLAMLYGVTDTLVIITFIIALVWLSTSQTDAEWQSRNHNLSIEQYSVRTAATC